MDHAAPAASRDMLERVAALDGKALLRRARALASEPGDAWDLLQDTFERALLHAPAGLPPRELRAWLLTTLKNLFIDRHCRAKRARHVPLSEHLLPAASESQSALPRWRLVDEADLQRSVAQLDHRLREVFVLHAEERLPLSDIASRLNIPVATAGTRLFRARRHLRAALELESQGFRAERSSWLAQSTTTDS